MLARFCTRVAALALASITFLPLSAHAAIAKAEPFPHAVLWRIDKAGVPSSWLFGTAHVADPRVTTLSDPVAQAFESSDQVYTEVKTDFSMMMELAKAVLRPEGDLLPAHISDAYYQKLLPELAARDYPEVATRRLKTWAAAMLMMEPKKQSGQITLDLLLAKMAIEGGKNYSGLETVQEQLSLFENIPEDKQRTLLYSLLDHQEVFAAQINKVIDAYVARDIPAIERLSEQGDVPMPAADEAYFDKWNKKDLLIDRNLRFAQRLQEPLAKGGNFIAIGAMHLPGPQGLVALLRKAGYTLTPVFDTPTVSATK
ncbi:TraB/GumN family protein [Silvimonas sp.]|uniref:TraB/GumN family protein n=1 Tax=Silvimonas sp. TaxID=2650811 RepID=UPI00283D3BB5|nr:TraB/GumN family protein [Silvimonas sp.]MDR3428004.1 TraB/GumN family protein [Silvimonas sp.]